jgi:DNA-binding NtrC family response regulator
VVDRGTTVRLSFVPATPADDIIDVKVVTDVPALRILLVDDDPLVLSALEAIVAADGHTVASADGGQAGIDAFLAAKSAGEPFQVVMTDLGMPHVDGRRVSAAVKEADPNTVVLLLTGWGQRSLATGDVPEHVDRVLSKPPKLRELRETLALTMAIRSCGFGIHERPA